MLFAFVQYIAQVLGNGLVVVHELQSRFWGVADRLPNYLRCTRGAHIGNVEDSDVYLVRAAPPMDR